MKEKEENLKQNVYNNSAYARREIAVYIHTRTQTQHRPEPRLRTPRPASDEEVFTHIRRKYFRSHLMLSKAETAHRK